ncbi:uncharacterized protein FFM5_15359 [Fusarium fujikuroi]|nr:uncharacterized protein FFM5_15359 [Fusarium fujikuroi]
MRYLSRYNY